MKPENRNTLKKSVEALTALGFKPENIMVTGSIALDIVGVLPPNRWTHDIDFIIKMDDKSWHCMKLLEAIEKVDIDKDIKYPDDKNMVFLKIKGINTNIWRHTPNFDWSTVKDTETGVMVATVSHIIQAKKSYGRPKDYQDLIDICKNIL